MSFFGFYALYLSYCFFQSFKLFYFLANASVFACFTAILIFVPLPAIK